MGFAGVLCGRRIAQACEPGSHVGGEYAVGFVSLGQDLAFLKNYMVLKRHQFDLQCSQGDAHRSIAKGGLRLIVVSGKNSLCSESRG